MVYQNSKGGLLLFELFHGDGYVGGLPRPQRCSVVV